MGRHASPRAFQKPLWYEYRSSLRIWQESVLRAVKTTFRSIDYTDSQKGLHRFFFIFNTFLIGVIIFIIRVIRDFRAFSEISFETLCLVFPC
jgi:hypothetical protein